MTAYEQILSQLKSIIKDLTACDIVPHLEYPADPAHGDYASNVAMAMFQKVSRVSQVSRASREWKSPMEVAQEIAKRLEVSSQLEVIDRVEAVPPGFINFWLSKDYLISQLQEVLEEGEKFGTTINSELSGKKNMVEFADPNPFKEFHIGHLRNISLGESLSRLLEAQGAKVFRANYQGDVGMHVAKALYGIQSSEFRVQNEDLSLAEKMRILGRAYALGSRAYEEDEGAKKEIQDLNIKIYKNDSEIREIWEIGRKWSLDAFEQIYKRLGTKYDYYYFESQTAPVGRQLVLDHLENGVFERHDGAVVFRGEKFGLHTRVFVTKEDYATYEAKDLALAQLKYKDVAYDRSIIITAHEQAPYFSVILVALKLIESDLAAKTVHYSFGFVSLKTGKMSSRKGEVITAQWLLDEAKTRIKKQFKEISEETAEKVAVGAVKYSLLKFSPASDIVFSFDESISLEGNSGPYLQYAYARTQSILAKVKSQKSKVKIRVQNLKVKQLEPEESALLRRIHLFPEVVGEAAEQFAPNLLCNYLFELAQAFNLFYQKHKIIDPTAGSGREVQALRGFRLALTASVGQILKNGLYLLGIESPERM
ncbi:MAG: arginine--tRNA ligase [Candidatus Levybacteria bacterium]|nr:arginine--tRNA ligase [Candidatus Levybacteria bacterium]MBI2190114.1 arginine--tRNA ligase [Candidatus Levybacteria bacterium]MBI2622796.1 arginine--tRNA ligase [Candidatus Levybacteria bacterium]MBI3070185.1 arginine--tRNA ligase [Candidatus Levybacteria bacterium]MBI3092651.1 arginine--tRNA ligase [Candidatus Levybacteria bacterium]